MGWMLEVLEAGEAVCLVKHFPLQQFIDNFLDIFTAVGGNYCELRLRPVCWSVLKPPRTPGWSSGPPPRPAPSHTLKLKEIVTSAQECSQRCHAFCTLCVWIFFFFYFK